MSKKRPQRDALFAAAGNYSVLLADIKRRIRAGQVRTAMAGNASMLMLYWEIGGVLAERQKQAGWGAAFLPKLAGDLHNELPEVKGFSARNMRRMIQFQQEYPELFVIWPRPVAKLQRSLPANSIWPLPVAKIPQTTISTAETKGPLHVAQLPWAHNVILIEKIKDLSTRLWYARQALEHGWSRDVLSCQIESRAHERHGKAVTNFKHTLPPPQSDLASQLLKDPYLFDFLTLEKPFHERELETGLLRHLQEFLVALGTGFAFVGRQVHLEVDGDDFYLDLLFYHLRLRCFMVIDLKVGRFKAEYAGKMNFYLNVVDDRMRHATDQPTIGLILCEDTFVCVKHWRSVSVCSCRQIWKSGSLRLAIGSSSPKRPATAFYWSNSKAASGRVSSRGEFMDSSRRLAAAWNRSVCW